LIFVQATGKDAVGLDRYFLAYSTLKAGRENEAIVLTVEMAAAGADI